MRHLALTLALLSCAALPAAAETRPQREPSPAQLAQQERMRQCSATAKQRSLQGDPRKAFIKECLARRAAG
jgi:psiF repeat